MPTTANAAAPNAAKPPAPTPGQIQATILAQSQPVLIPHDSGTQTFGNVGTQNPLQFSIKPRYVGLVRSFTLRVQMTITANSAMTRTAFGAANLLSNFIFTDLNSIQRMNTSGRHLNVVNSMARKRRANSARLLDTPSGWNSGTGINVAGSWGVLVENCPATIASGTTVTLAMTYDIPVSYAYNDLRGSIYLNTVQAQLSLQGIVNNVGAFIGAGGDPLNAVYTCAGALPTVSTVVIDGLQDYLDQLPQIKTSAGSNILLPIAMMGQIYNLVEQPYAAAMVANADFPVSFGDARSYLSATLTFDNGGVYNYGSDVNTISLISAGSYVYWKKNPSQIVKRTRDWLGCDPPAGQYLFSFKSDPITTQEYGNTRLIINPAVVNAGAQLVVGFEFFSTAATVAGSGVSGVG